MPRPAGDLPQNVWRLWRVSGRQNVCLVCDDQLFIKITKEGAALDPQLPKAPPYDGAKDYFLYEDVDDREHMIAFVQATCRELPMPKPKKKKGAT